MSERMTAEELAGEIGRLYDGNYDTNNPRKYLNLASALIETDRRETERLCAERAVAWINLNLVDMHMPLMLKRLEEGELIAAITSPAKEDSHEEV